MMAKHGRHVDQSGWTPERLRRYRRLIGYLHSQEFIDDLNAELRAMRSLSRAGVAMSPDQQAQIHALVEQQDTAAAQKLILEYLTREIGE